ncbi:Double-stranded RNA-binding protein 4 [Camellia lanceoleosa]|uniref:Double-stranded RNA-binding protein 4 n=1 Tax=Camellia lanceoleosa TaxID=1840588 RepID=A0ACC0FWD6_9ERIC|nr:Double-stranded RNA-binding protein 4 [Camellia lanceoleosa]
MYKSKLQFLCQQKSWDLPDYSVTKDGPDHIPRFKATVIVNGVPFETDDQSRTAKDAQNKVAKLALDQLSAPPPPPPPSRFLNPNLSLNLSLNSPQPSLSAEPQLPASSSSGFSSPTSYSDINLSIGGTTQPTMIKAIQTPLVNEACLRVKDDAQHLYKSRLQSYAQRRNLTLPEYSSEREGPPHASRFRSKVLFDGKIYESPEFSLTIKEAEHAAAKVAWESLSLNEVEEDDSTVYKNLLQELAQKKGFLVPKYERTVSGPPHMPTFVSTVKIGEESFQGQAAKSKKQADMNAAKVAYNCLQERNKASVAPTVLSSVTPTVLPSVTPTVLSSGCQIKKALEDSSSILQSVIAGDLQKSGRPEVNFVNHETKDEEYIDKNEGQCSSKLTTVNAKVSTGCVPAPSSDANTNAKRCRYSPSPDLMYASLRDPFPSTSSSPSDGVSSPSHSEGCTNSSMDSNNETAVEASAMDTALVRILWVTPARKT